MEPVSAFDDLLAANIAYADAFADAGLQPVAARGLAILTCMDSRIDPNPSFRIVRQRAGGSVMCRAVHVRCVQYTAAQDRDATDRAGGTRSPFCTSQPPHLPHLPSRRWYSSGTPNFSFQKRRPIQ